MTYKFTKMQGAGNDYIYFDCINGDAPKNLSDVAVKLSDRHFGIGGDGIVLIMRSRRADVRMRMFNADGSEGRMCGNAIRCVAKYVYDNGICNKQIITVETLSGIKTLQFDVYRGKVRSVLVDMGKAVFDAGDIPVISDDQQVVNLAKTALGEEYRITCVSMGNPHCVVFVKDVDGFDVERVGKAFENDPMFPERVNAEFVEILDADTIKMRVWERGSGETLACGTGACAAVSAAVKNGFLDANREICVKLLGGELKITYTSDAVFMRGGAEKAFDGEVSL